MGSERLLGSYLLRVVASSDGATSITLHSVLHGTSHRFVSFDALAAYLAAAGTASDPRDPEE